MASQGLRVVRELEWFDNYANYSVKRKEMANVAVLPNVNYKNLLYVYPLPIEKCNFRNVTVKVELRNWHPQDFKSQFKEQTMPKGSADLGGSLPDSCSSSMRAIYGRSCTSVLTDSATVPVTYHSNKPPMGGEIKVRLPTVMKPSHHMLFTLYHVHCKKRKNETSPQEVIGYGILPIFSPEDEKILKSENDEGEVSVMVRDGLHEIMVQVGTTLTEAYSCYTPVKPRAGGHDGKDRSRSSFGSLSNKLTFINLQVATRLRSSLYTQDPPLNQFFASYGNIAVQDMSATAGHEDLDSIGKEKPSPEMAVQTMLEAIHRLPDANPFEVTSHILSTFRFVLDIIKGKLGSEDSDFADKKSRPLKDIATVALLQLFRMVSIYSDQVNLSASSRCTYFLNCHRTLIVESGVYN